MGGVLQEAGDAESRGHARSQMEVEYISSLLTPSHLFDCIICTRMSVSIVLLLQMVGGWDRCSVVDLY